MKRILIGAVTIATVALPVAALAATYQTYEYQYVNTSGALETEMASSVSQALTQPTDIAPHSGVILVTNDPTVTVTPTPNPTENSVTGTYSDALPAADATGRTMYLTLLPAGSVILSTIYANNATPVIESGTWNGSGSNQIQVTLTGNANQTYSPVHTITFNVDGSTLSATAYDMSLYGSQGLTFTK